MPGSNGPEDVLRILDTSTISHIFLSYYRQLFPSLWGRFDELLLGDSAVSVRTVRVELERTSRVPDAIGYLESLAPGFFAEPNEQEQALVREMTNDPSLSAAANRSRSKESDDADPYLIAKARASLTPVILVTQESENPARASSIHAVCNRFGVRCTNLEQMMTELDWRF